MSKIGKSFLCYIMLCFAIIVSPASAQQLPGLDAPAQAPAPTAQLAATPANFPALPPSKPCDAGDIFALWQLTNVYEQPAGTQQAEFARMHFQYLAFYRSNVLGTYENNNNNLTRTDILNAMERQNSKMLQQFVMKSGFIYAYKKGNLADTMACFIVTSARPSFHPGQLLLMPPREQAGQRRLVKVYDRVSDPQAPHPQVPPLPAAQPAGAKPPAPAVPIKR